MSLAESFPLSERQRYAQEHLTPGCIVRVVVRFPQGAKPKFLIIAFDDDEECLAFVINTEIHPFIARSRHLHQ